ncbi:FAD-dependent 5-carboxymethylaminomethyl-2-thiouridine(34) oxidoreductase MnmC [Stenoxybacter acetivorans]|uniref:FAD-dependent 5-carboxymethylaminomethyl-2-thiouridine(34) oxidoreductase MnmC n=1 Tax=Stenoxybacter acetivorans TaxID=422441 RepID=UPI00068B62E0|nr:FAD-dependent 5-carboxymethylaminomethyl-2-thiouridine(34) oxidoreductase MnmC [Stenoxybacter acetivorans]
MNTAAVKPWFRPPPAVKVQHVAVVGAGIAGAATAFALAARGIHVTVLEENQPATAASGNRQGLLYAKISPHNTAQTELLLAGYRFSRQLLTQTLPLEYWQTCGVLHLNHNERETERNRQLAARFPNHDLYQAVNAEEAGELAGIELDIGGLWWHQGAWIHPPSWVNTLLTHPNIRVIAHARVRTLEIKENGWDVVYQLTENNEACTLHASHVVVCAGINSNRFQPFTDWTLHPIRGQTTTANSGELAKKLRCALSGESYISPSWQNKVCFGATFLPQNNDNHLHLDDETHNWQTLARLHLALAHDIQAASQHTIRPQGHAAVRCDAFDHLPIVGVAGNAAAMRRVYARLASDKNYRINDDCPYWNGLYVNTAHGSRGLATAPICGEAIACAILGLPSPLSMRLQTALHPNRLIIRGITHH